MMRVENDLADFAEIPRARLQEDEVGEPTPFTRNTEAGGTLSRSIVPQFHDALIDFVSKEEEKKK